jgi:transketolase
MKKPEEVLAKHGYPMPGDDLDLNLVKAMEEYKNQFIDFDGPVAMIDHYSRLARNWEDAHANLEKKLRNQYDAEFEAFKVSFEQRTRNDFEQQLNEAIHADASEITALRQELDKRDESIKNLLRINETLNTVIKKISTGQIHDPSVYNDGLRANEIDLNSGQNVSFREEPRNSGWSV